MKNFLYKVFLLLCAAYMLVCVVWLCGWYPDHPTNWDDVALHPFDN